MITIYSPGICASKYTPEEYIQGHHESVIRNETIAKMLYLNKSIEQFGSGFKRIDSLCKDARIKYAYESGRTGFKFTLFRRTTNSTENVTVNVFQNVTVNKTEQAVYALLKDHPEYTRDQLAERTAKTVRTVQRTLDSLREKGLIDRIGSDKAGKWIIKQ